jgi:tRNA G10  N-methylase Trm11
VTVLAADRWHTNAELIAACAELGYLRAEWHVLDPTYGRGVWWKRWRPDKLTACTDRTLDAARADDPAEHFVYGVDFRRLPFGDDTFDAVAYDPPYVSIGGRKTSGIADMHDRFGLTDAPTSPAGVQQLIDDGLTDVHRVVRPGGIVLTKCQDYVSSGRLWPGTHYTLTHAFELGFELVDRFEHVGNPRPQPGGRRQVHARRNLSTLFVLHKAKQ